MHVVVLTETKRKGRGVEKPNDYIDVFSLVPKHGQAKRGLSVMIHKIYQCCRRKYNQSKSWRQAKQIYHSMSMYDIRWWNRCPKGYILWKLNDRLMNFGKGREIIVLVHLNFRTGRDKNNSIIGTYGENHQNG